MKTLGQPAGTESLWLRFRRLQRTGGAIMGGLPYAQGVQRFHSFEAADTWQNQQRLNRRARPKTAI